MRLEALDRNARLDGNPCKKPIADQVATTVSRYPGLKKDIGFQFLGFAPIEQTRGKTYGHFKGDDSGNCVTAQIKEAIKKDKNGTILNDKGLYQLTLGGALIHYTRTLQKAGVTPVDIARSIHPYNAGTASPTETRDFIINNSSNLSDIGDATPETNRKALLSMGAAIARNQGEVVLGVFGDGHGEISTTGTPTGTDIFKVTFNPKHEDNPIDLAPDKISPTRENQLSGAFGMLGEIREMIPELRINGSTLPDQLQGIEGLTDALKSNNSQIVEGAIDEIGALYREVVLRYVNPTNLAKEESYV